MANISMSRRTIALVISVALAAVATIAIFSYVQSLEDRALEDAEPVEVFVAKDVIPVGTSADSAITQGLFEQTTVPQRVRPLDAIASLEEIRGRVAGVTIQQGEQILASRFVAPGQQGGGLTIPSNRVAMSIEVDIPPGVANFVRVGDRISAIAHLSVPRGAGADAEEESRSQFVVQNMEVLAVGRRVITTTEEGQEESTQQTQNRILMTIAVTPAQAERMAFSINEGGLYLTLLPEDFGAVTTPGRTARNVFP